MKRIALALAAVGALALAAPSFAQTSVNTGATVKSGATGTNVGAGAATSGGGAAINANAGASTGMKSGMKARAQASTHVKHSKHVKRHTPSATVGAGGSVK